MTVAIQQEATALFARDLAAFLDEAIAKLDALAARRPEKTLAEPKPLKQSRKKKRSIADAAGAESCAAVQVGEAGVGDGTDAYQIEPNLLPKTE